MALTEKIPGINFGSKAGVSKRSLRQDLIEAGLTPMSNARVDEHIRRMNAFNRPTIWHWGFFLFAQLVWFCTLEPIIRLMLARRPLELQGLVLSIVFALSVVVGGLGFFFTGHGAFAIVGVPALALVTTILFVLFGDLVGLGTFVNSVHAWHRIPIESLEADELIPAEAKRDASIAATIPGAKVNVLTLGGDPFLEVSRGRWSSIERACIAAWDTGDPELNTIHRKFHGQQHEFRHPAFGGRL